MLIKKTLIFNTLLDINGQPLEDNIELDLNIVEKSGNYLIHKDISRHRIHQKQGTVSTKTRSEVSGGGRKPWRQKGTGRARAGSNRSPLWKGGGVVFGPKPKTSIIKSNKKERKLALKTLLYNKRNTILVITDLENKLERPKTKMFFDFCQSCKIDLDKRVLIIVSKKSASLRLSVRNLKKIELISASNLNTFSILKAEQIILTPFAINDIKEIYCD